MLPAMLQRLVTIAIINSPVLLLALDFASECLPNEQSPIRGSSCDILTIGAVRGCRCVGCVCGESEDV